MKPIHFLPPVVALAITGFLIGGQRNEISRLEQQSELLSYEIARAKSRPVSVHEKSRPERSNVTNGENQPIDWNEIALMAEETGGSGKISDMRQIMSLQRRLLEMSKEELVAALNEIESLDLTDEQRTGLIGMILDPLALKDPELVLNRFSDRLNDNGFGITWRLSRALGNWAEKDGPAAAAWLDQQIGAGTFASKSLDGKNQKLRTYESTLFASLLGSHPDLAEQRLAAMPEDKRKNVLEHRINQLKKEDQAVFADIVRRQIGSDGAAEILADKVNSIVMVSDLEDVDGYIERISATSQERKKIAEEAAKSYIEGKSYEGKVTPADIDKMRDWLGGQSPASVEKNTGSTLGSLANDGVVMGFEQSAALALRYHEQTGDDEILVGFFENLNHHPDKDAARSLAAKISDPEKRKRALNSIE